MQKISNIGRNASTVFLALMIVGLPFASTQPVQAADLSSGYSYSYSYPSPSPSSSGSSYSYSYPSSNSSSGYSYSYSYPSSSSGYSYSYSYPETDYGCQYNCGGSDNGCKYNCGGDDGGCKYNCGGGCKYNCGGDNGGCKHNCNPPTPKVPSCTISINPSHVDYDGEATITWSSTNADSASLTDFGSVSVDGSRHLTDITEDATYTLTVKGHGKTVTCSDKVTVEEEEEEEEDMQCKLRASESRIDRGDSVKISWSSEGAEWGKISPTIGEVDEDGSETVRPRETTTYKGTFYNDEGDKVTCSVKVKVDEDVYIPPHTPYITLSSVPYTGFELGPVGTAIYWSLLVLWCLIASYLIAVKKAHVSIARRLNSFLFGSHSQVATVAPTATIVHKTAPAHSVRTVHSDTTDEFVLSQLARGRHA